MFSLYPSGQEGDGFVNAPDSRFIFKSTFRAWKVNQANSFLFRQLFIESTCCVTPFPRSWGHGSAVTSVRGEEPQAGAVPINVLITARLRPRGWPRSQGPEAADPAAAGRPTRCHWV